MTFVTEPQLHCDYPECGKVLHHPITQERRKGWFMRGGYDFCPKHDPATAVQDKFSPAPADREGERE